MKDIIYSIHFYGKLKHVFHGVYAYDLCTDALYCLVNIHYVLYHQFLFHHVINFLFETCFMLMYIIGVPLSMRNAIQYRSKPRH